MTEQTTVPNHHADYPGFSGVSGLRAALSMLTKGDDDARLVARLGGVGPGDSVVDIGCGPGAAARHAAGLGASVTAVDPARVMLRVARLLTSLSRSRSRVRYVEGIAEALPVEGDFASVVWSIASVHHWRDIAAGVREARRVLRSRGRFVAMERHTVPGAHGLAGHGWTRAQAEAFAECCRAHGFGDVRVEENTIGRRSTVSVVATAP